MRLIGKTASTLLICVGLLTAGFASPALAAGTSADFEGVWETEVVEVNAHYRLYLHHDGNKVEGNFVSEQDPKYNGTLKGSVEKGRLTYSYVQPEVKGEGFGYFTIDSDFTITGLTSPGRGLGKQYRWRGTPDQSTLNAHTTTKPEPAQNGVKVTGAVTGYDAPSGNDKCFLHEGETATVIGSDQSEPKWKHLQGTGACDGQDFWIYDEKGILKAL